MLANFLLMPPIWALVDHSAHAAGFFVALYPNLEPDTRLMWTKSHFLCWDDIVMPNSCANCMATTLTSMTKCVTGTGDGAGEHSTPSSTKHLIPASLFCHLLIRSQNPVSLEQFGFPVQLHGLNFTNRNANHITCQKPVSLDVAKLTGKSLKNQVLQ